MRVLIVDDDADVRERLITLLHGLGLTPEAGHEIVEATDAASCLTAVAEQAPDIITMDGYLGEDEDTCDRGPDVVASLRAHGCTAKIIMVSGSGKMCRKGIDAGADGHCGKHAILQDLPGIFRRFGAPVAAP